MADVDTGLGTRRVAMANAKADQALLRWPRARFAESAGAGFAGNSAALGQGRGEGQHDRCAWPSAWSKNVRVRFAALQTIRQAKLGQFAPDIIRLAATETDRITFYAVGCHARTAADGQTRTLLGENAPVCAGLPCSPCWSRISSPQPRPDRW